MREAQVDPAAVDVEVVAEILPGHRRALEVPARATDAVWRGPARARRFGRLRPLPQGEVAGVMLATGVRVLGGSHVVDALASQFAIRGPGSDIEVDVAALVGGRIGVALLDQQPHQLDHLGDVAGGAGLVGRGQDPEEFEGVAGQPLIAIGQGEPVFAGLVGLAQDLVVNVGDIAHERDVEAVAAGQPATQDIEGDGEADMPDVGRRLGRQATDVNPDPARCDGDEIANLPSGGVEQAQAHPVRLPGARERHLTTRGDPT
jgi:hypothetical protein